MPSNDPIAHAPGALLHRHGPNLRGRDLAVGDIHGNFTGLQLALDAVGFDPACDRLFCVGDLIDRGPESHAVLDWLARPWFHSVRGNHESYPIRIVRTGQVDIDNYVAHGGGWFMELDRSEQERYARELDKLPFALSVQTQLGEVGLIHAEPPVWDWSRLETALAQRRGRDWATWSRRRYALRNASPVRGVRAVVVGHQPIADVLVLGNIYYIDTGGWLPDGRYTLLDLASLQPAGPPAPLSVPGTGARRA